MSLIGAMEPVDVVASKVEVRDGLLVFTRAGKTETVKVAHLTENIEVGCTTITPQAWHLLVSMVSQMLAGDNIPR